MSLIQSQESEKDDTVSAQTLVLVVLCALTHPSSHYIVDPRYILCIFYLYV